MDVARVVGGTRLFNGFWRHQYRRQFSLVAWPAFLGAVRLLYGMAETTFCPGKYLVT